MTEKQLKTILQTPIYEKHVQMESKYITEDRRLVASHHSNQRRMRDYQQKEFNEKMEQILDIRGCFSYNDKYIVRKLVCEKCMDYVEETRDMPSIEQLDFWTENIIEDMKLNSEKVQTLKLEPNKK